MLFQELKGNLSFQGILNWILQILHYSSQDWTKMFPNHKVLGEEKKIELLHKREITAIGKSSMQNQIKSRKIFLHTNNKISENFDIKDLQWSITDLSKETKKSF